MMAWAVECENITKKYPGVMALNRVTFQMAENKIYGLVGRNGAGKTTLLHLLSGQIFPTAGRICIAGETLCENSPVLAQICLIKENRSYPHSFFVTDILKIAASLYPRWDRGLAASLLEDYGLSPRRRFGQLSLGMKSSLGTIIGLSSRAPLTLFDEPSLGLDAAGRSLFYSRLLEDYGAHPRTVLISTHLIAEVSKLLEVVMIIDQGKILLVDEREKLLQRSFYLSGRLEHVEALIAEKNVLSREQIGGSMVAAVCDTLTEQERTNARQAGIDISPIPLQDTVILLTTKKGSVSDDIDSQS